MNWYKKAQLELNLEKDPNNSSNVILYHATRKPRLIKEKGIIPHRAGVIRQQNFALVYTSTSPVKAKMAVEYEDDLKEKMGINSKKVRGDLFIVKISVPISDITQMPNGDVTLDRIVLPSEIKEINPA